MHLYQSPHQGTGMWVSGSEPPAGYRGRSPDQWVRVAKKLFCICTGVGQFVQKSVFADQIIRQMFGGHGPLVPGFVIVLFSIQIKIFVRRLGVMAPWPLDSSLCYCRCCLISFSEVFVAIKRCFEYNADVCVLQLEWEPWMKEIWRTIDSVHVTYSRVITTSKVCVTILTTASIETAPTHQFSALMVCVCVTIAWDLSICTICKITHAQFANYFWSNPNSNPTPNPHLSQIGQHILQIA